MRSYISNSVIAYDNMNRYMHSRKGVTHLVELGYDVRFTPKPNKFGQMYICVYRVNLKPEEFGLKVPSNLAEGNRQKKVIKLTEHDLCHMVQECIRRVFKEQQRELV